MAFKADTSFLRFLSMGAAGVKQTMNQLRTAGFEPIELERYCSSNKLWMTKIKRLRLPDILCVRTGLRLEVRAKSDLKIRMSDAPNNPDRTWDASLRDDDLVAFIAMFEADTGTPRAADEAVFFSVRALRQSANNSQLGPPKSASEGAERDRTWPAIIPSCDGTVQSVNRKKVIVQMETGEKAKRKQTYALKGKHAYVRPGDRFRAGVSILGGVPAAMADLREFLAHSYAPLAGLGAANPVDRYAAVKAIPYRNDLRNTAIDSLEAHLVTETEERVALEVAGSAARLGSEAGQERIKQVLWGEGRKDLRMEAVLILTELGGTFARAELVRVAEDPYFKEDEIRQAAVWGLGKSGLKAYEELLPFIADVDEDVALHAILAFGGDTPELVIRRLVEELIAGDPRKAPAASEALRLIGTESALRLLIEAASGGNEWVLATLGRLPLALVKPALQATPLMNRVAPMLLLSTGANWLASQDRVMDIAFLAKQNL